MPKALIVVDYQNDFLPGGALGVTDGHQATVPILKLAKQLEQGDVLVMSQDWHPEDHFSFSNDPEYKDGSWPAHCVQGTEGAELDEILLEVLTQVVDENNLNFAIVHKGTDSSVEAYSAFDGNIVGTGEPLVTYLRDHNVKEVIVTGLALDYCVHATAISANAHLFDVLVPLDATRPVSYLTGGKAIAEMVEAGVEVDGTPLL